MVQFPNLKKKYVLLLQFVSLIDVTCFIGNGENYHGNLSVGRMGIPCLNWTQGNVISIRDKRTLVGQIYNFFYNNVT